MTHRTTTTTAVLLAALASLLLSSPAWAGSGGVAASDGQRGSRAVPGTKAKLLANGKALAPDAAPPRVKRAIRFANRIRRKPYIYGGGHRDFRIAKGYDCSSAVSYMLHGANALDAPMASGPLMKWGISRRGRWISVYAHGAHAYAVVAGLRWDTAGGDGPRWHSDMRSPRGFTVRHPRGL